MALRSAPLLLLVLVAVALWENCFGSSLHSMKYFSTTISDQCQGLPHFVDLGSMDDQIFAHYDSNSRKFQPRVPWMKKVDKNDSEYWDRYTEILQDNEKIFKKGLENLRARYNHSKGFHTWQRMVGCELQPDGSKGGSWQYGYEGRTFITFDKDTLTWVAPDPQAQTTKRKWDAIAGLNQYIKSYLEEECIEWLEMFLSYRNETPPRKEIPVVTVSRRMAAEDGMETHVCRLDGFYPREIDASWTRDGEVWLQDTFHGSVVPNADGTYHFWLSIQIDPKERDHYRCHVEHDGLQEPLDVAIIEPTFNLWLIIGLPVGLLIVIVGGLALICLFKRRQNDNNAAPGRNQGILQPLRCTSGHSQHEERQENMESRF